MNVAVGPAMAVVTREHRPGSFWRRLTDVERIALTDVAQLRRYAKGKALIRIADTDKWAAILYSGRVRVIGVDGTRAIATRWAGDIVGEQALIDGGKRSATVLADTAVRALLLGGRELDDLLGRYPRMLRVLCAVVSERLREADRNLSGKADDAFTKVMKLLVRYADEFGSAGERGVRVHIGSQAGLGESLAVSRESVVRALRTLRAENIVTTHRGLVTIRDLDALRARVTGNES